MWYVYAQERSQFVCYDQTTGGAIFENNFYDATSFETEEDAWEFIRGAEQTNWLPIPIEDKLDVILEKQNELNARVGISQECFASLSHEGRKIWIKRYCIAIIGEVIEVLKECGYEWWKTKEWDMNKLQSETIDVLRFTLSLCFGVGLDTKKLFHKYVEIDNFAKTRPDWDKNKESACSYPPYTEFLLKQHDLTGIDQEEKEYQIRSY